MARIGNEREQNQAGETNEQGVVVEDAADEENLGDKGV